MLKRTIQPEVVMARTKRPTLLGTRAGATQRRINYAWASGAVGTIVDIGQSLSLVNHRLYKQNRVYYARVGWIGTNAPVAPAPHSMTIKCAQNNWQIRKAFAFAQSNYWKSYRDELNNANVKPGRWNQFTVDYEVAGGLATMLPDQIAGGTAEWNDSEVRDLTHATNTLQFALLGGTVAGVEYGILDRYDISADTEQDSPPAASTAAPYASIHGDEVDSASAEILQEHGDNPPYNPVTLQHQEQRFEIAPGTVAGVVNFPHFTPWIEVPCGLIELTPNSVGTEFNGNLFCVELAPGPYKGVLAEAM
ncbi:MAG: putative replicase [Circoviridae sp.]|nr:MAG: putative replicase [Circoviridae sp.]